jgi:hypothetical protein
MDSATKIYDTLYNNWGISNPSRTDITWKKDEFDPKGPLFQMVIENYPIRKVWVSDVTYKIEHNVKISIYCKPKRYDLDTIDNTRTLWFNMKGEVDRILRQKKYLIAGIDVVEMRSGWDDRETIAVGRGIKKAFLGKKHPIIWLSEQIVTCIYYVSEGLVEKEELYFEPYTTHVGVQLFDKSHVLPSPAIETLHTEVVSSNIKTSTISTIYTCPLSSNTKTCNISTICEVSVT